MLDRLETAAREGTTEYLRAAAERQRLRHGFARLFEEVDLLLTPVSAGSPVPSATRRSNISGRRSSSAGS